MSFFGGKLQFDAKIIEREVVSIDIAHGELRSEVYEDERTPCMIFLMDVGRYPLVKQLKFDPHDDRLVVHYISRVEGADNKVAVATEAFECRLNAWMRCCPPMKDGVLQSSTFMNSIRSLIKCAISTYKLFGDFLFEQKNIHCRNMMTKDECAVKIVLFEKFKHPERSSRIQYVQCMKLVAAIINCWFQQHHQEDQIPLDLNLLMYIMERLWLSYNPHKRNGLMLLLQSPVFYVGEAKEKAFEFVLRVRWWTDYRNHSRANRHLIAAFKQMGYNVTVETPWYREGVLGPILQACYDKQYEPLENDMAHFLRAFRNLATHFKEHVVVRRDTTTETCYNEMERMVPGCWAAVHLVAMWLCSTNMIDN